MNRLEGIIGGCAAIRRVYFAIEKAATMDMPVLIEGETGTGKELVASAIHTLGRRSRGPFVSVNTGTMAPPLVLSELFGHVAGAYTGAAESTGGRFSEADGGTLFLDEITTMEERVQVTLLHVLESGHFRPLGGSTDDTSDARIVAATNVPLARAVADGQFRADLMYRLGVFRITVPPLRERKSDIPLLAGAFVSDVRDGHELDVEGIAPEALERLCAFSWPGNIRQLKNVVSQACVAAGSGTIKLEHLPARVRNPKDGDRAPAPSADTAGDSDGGREADDDPDSADAAAYLPLGNSLEEIRKIFVMNTLEHYRNNKTLAAESLGISRKGLYDMVARWSVTAK